MTLTRLKYVATVAYSSVDKKTVEGQPEVRLCNYLDVYNNRTITPDIAFMRATATEAQIEKFTLRAGDVIITKDSERPDDIGVPAYVAEDLPGVVCGYHLALIRVDRERLDPRYLYWYLASEPARQYFDSRANGVTRFGLRQEAVGMLPLPAPSLTEQRSVTRELDSHTERLDRLRDALIDQLPRIAEYRRALVTEALRPIVPAGSN